MMPQNLPPTIANIVNLDQSPAEVLSGLLPVVGEFLECDRCFLYLHNPQTGFGRVAFCWVRTPDIPRVYHDKWQLQPSSLPKEDPMFAAALRAEPSIFIEDIETANPQILNRQFEQKTFGHRALIHAHIRHHGQLWGILQPCVFSHPRIWTEYEQEVINNLVQQITPLAISYVKSALGE
ncbi:MAG: GAF domain-containing protein [Desmonostoc vinosum HA7617-LM4]|jgi:GAF domain-containing protein|nr:GAF domain-containing protein [Desmonostoc vinosum HA7617-LM4]